MKNVYRIFDLEGKSAIVTGASKGLGFGMSESLAQAGVNVVMVNRNREEGENARKKLDHYDVNVLSIPADVSNRKEVTSMVDQAINELGRIDILINNAAIINRGPLLDLSEEGWSQTLDINLKGSFLCAQATAKHMAKNGGGKIINLASIRSSMVADERGAYSTSKGGVVQLTKAMALEWSKYNILVNAIAPGYFGTEMVSAYFEKVPSMETRVVDGIPLGRIGQPSDLCGLAIFLASAASNFITGQVIYIDGGWSTWKY